MESNVFKSSIDLMAGILKEGKQEPGPGVLPLKPDSDVPPCIHQPASYQRAKMTLVRVCMSRSLGYLLLL
jgi:hypothetical protein